MISTRQHLAPLARAEAEVAEAVQATLASSVRNNDFVLELDSRSSEEVLKIQAVSEDPIEWRPSGARFDVVLSDGRTFRVIVTTSYA